MRQQLATVGLDELAEGLAIAGPGPGPGPGEDRLSYGGAVLSPG